MDVTADVRPPSARMGRAGVVVPEMAAPTFDARLVRAGSDAVVVLVGDLDLATAGDFERTMSRALELADRWSVDASELRFVDSSGVRALLRAHAAVQRRGGRLRLTGLDGAARVAIDHMGLLGLLEG